MVGKKPETVFSGGKGAFEQVPPQTKGAISAPTKRHITAQNCTNRHKPAQTGTDRHRPAQTGTNRHKPAQTGTNRHKPFLSQERGSSLAPLIVSTCYYCYSTPVGRIPTGTNQHKPAHFCCHGRGEAHLPPFHCLLFQSAASAHLRGGGGTTERPPDGDARSGGLLAMGRCQGANAVASVLRSPCDWRHIRRHRRCGPILLQLPRSLSAAALPPLTDIVIFGKIRAMLL